MRDKTHDDFIERWVKFMKENPVRWRRIHAQFINAQFDNAHKFWERLLKTKNGKEKLIKIYNIKNLKGYEGLLNGKK